MVFDWFRRSSAPPPPPQTPAIEAPEAPAPQSPGAEAPISDPPTTPAPEAEVQASGGSQEPTPAAGAGPEAPASAAIPAAAAGIDQDALAWAREAYARLKAQQDAARVTAADADAALASPAAPSESLPEAPDAGASAEGGPVFESPVAASPLGGLRVPGPPLELELPQGDAAERLGVEPPDQGPARAGETSAAGREPGGEAAAPAAALPAAASPAAPALSLLEQAAALRQERLRQLTAPAGAAPVVEAEPAAPVSAVADSLPQESAVEAEAEPSLGAFDDAFTWSAEVLAAQGRRVEDVSIEEIDWLTRLRRGLEKTRRGFVTQLLETLGDDPLSPEVLDDLETTLLQADVGVQATDLVLEALRRRLNEEVVDPSEGLRFLKEQLRQLLDAPTQRDGRPLLAPSRDRLNIWLLVGVNGVGKTTTLGKLANLAVRSGYSCLIAAADTFRAAAVQQVTVWGERSGVPVIANATAH
ncbi:MAG: signal recognition particle receptor subunit alpha, partial [Synechococcaceae cyanobacterium]|nr:signal recognition particle receptor subunit alpha [Synechococcaceae cyanobacterium]